MSDKAYEYMNWPRIEAIVYGEEQSPRDVMGPRMTKDGVLIQGYFPNAKSASVSADGETYKMTMEDESGYFAVLLPIRKIPEYTYEVTWTDRKETFADPYAFPCQITEAEEKAFCSGVWYDAWKKLGAHPMEIGGVKGTLFAVWAPNALRVSLVGDFDRWDGRHLPMHRMPMSGIYELFVPGIGPGTLYKYEMYLKGGGLQLKADPYAFEAEPPLGDASVVAEPDSGYDWKDAVYMEKRCEKATFNVPISIYETSLMDWPDPTKLGAFLKEHRYTHVELHPVMEYMHDGSDGYPTSSYFALSTRYGKSSDLQKLVDDLHAEGIGVILDWNAAQFPRDAAGLSLFDGTPLYEPADPAAAVHPMWNTMLYNYGSPMVMDFLISNACFWAEIYHIDGLRLDDVDAMLYLDYGRKEGEYKPNMYGTNENLEAIEFLKHFNSIIHKKYPGFLTIAQEDGLWPCLTGSVEEDHIGFDYKWSGGWTSDFLRYLSVDPIMRKGYHDQLTLSMLYAYSEHYILTLGSRDTGDLEAFRKKIWGDEAQSDAQIREAYTYMYLHPGCKMSAPDGDLPEGLGQLLTDLNALYASQPALSRLDDSYEGFEWIQLMKYDENVLAFLRRTEDPDQTLLAVCNFAAVPYESYRVGVPFYGKYKEIFNTDETRYGGSGLVNPRAKTSVSKECDERDQSILIKLAPLSICVFSCTQAPAPVRKAVEKKTAAKKAPAGKAATAKKAPAGKASSAKKTAEKKAPAGKASAAKKTKKADSGKPSVKDVIAHKAEETVTEIKKRLAISGE